MRTTPGPYRSCEGPRSCPPPARRVTVPGRAYTYLRSAAEAERSRSAADVDPMRTLNHRPVPEAAAQRHEEPRSAGSAPQRLPIVSGAGRASDASSWIGMQSPPRRGRIRSVPSGAGGMVSGAVLRPRALEMRSSLLGLAPGGLRARRPTHPSERSASPPPTVASEADAPTSFGLAGTRRPLWASSFPPRRSPVERPGQGTPVEVLSWG